MLKKMAAVLAVLSLFCFHALAQNTQLTGVVTDPTGAVVANAELKLEDPARGTVREAKSDAQGFYRFLQVQPGTYKLTAKAPGFSDVVVGSIPLEVAKPSTQNVVFEKVGATSTTIAVTAESTQVNAVEGSVGNTIGTTPILQLPLFARGLGGLLSFQPGVTLVNTSPGNQDDDRNGAVNGGKSDQANVTLDGMDANQQSRRTAFTSVLRTTLDSTQEFRSVTSGGGAEFGRSSGAQIQLVTKSGSNEYHGSVYYYHRNTVTAANTFFNNASGVKRPALLINIPGASLGAPIIKNKLFYFLNYETRRDASATNVSRTVPSMLLRQGTVQYLFRETASSPVQTGQFTPADLRRLDPGGIGVSQAALQYMQSYPTPNAPELGDGLNIQGVRFTSPIKGKQDTYIAKFDYNLGDKHRLFWRGNLQNDRANGVQQFPGQDPRTVALENTKGYVISHSASITPNLLSTFRYGLTRQSFEDTGKQSAALITFRNLDSIFPVTRGLARAIPVHQISQDFNLVKGRHSINVGGTMRWISNRSTNFNRAFNNAAGNASWLTGTGSQLANLVPGLQARDAYLDAMVLALGLVTQATGNYNYNIDGSLLATGLPVQRNFKNEEYEWYAQDTWRLKKNLTLTLGIRHSLMPAPFEADGVQISPTIPLGTWFDTRQGLADRGLPQSGAGQISYVRADSPQGRSIYPFYKKNFAPRASFAWSPDGDGKFARFLTGGSGKTSIRGSWGMYYDLIGQPLVATYDATAFGFATTLNNPSSSVAVETADRFTGAFNYPTRLLRPAPRGGFPATPGNDFAIINTIDDTLQMPYVMRTNFSIGREFKNGFFIEASYVGSFSRRSLMNRDLAMPTNPTDPRSGQTYFEAASGVASQVLAGVPTANLTPQPFFENFYSNFATATASATQGIVNAYGRNTIGRDMASALENMEYFCSPRCGRLGPGFIFNQQYSALSAWSSVGGGSYNAIQVVARKRFSQGLLLDFNYTVGRSQDLASVAERGGSFSGFLLNPFNPSQRRAVSDYDARHIYSAFVVWELPFGRGKRFGSGSGRLMDALIGGWQLSPTWQQSTELPTSVGNGRTWPTNYNITPFATPNGTPPVSTKGKLTRAPSGAIGPNLFADPTAALAFYSPTLPGQSGSRNTTRIDGTFNINLGVAKRIAMPYKESHTIQIRWETFNLTNAVRFAGANLSLGDSGNFGRYTSLLNRPREMQFAFRYEF